MILHFWKVVLDTYGWILAGLPTSQIAYSAFTLGTAAVLPFYTLMVVAPKAEFVSLVISNFPFTMKHVRNLWPN